MKTFTSQIDNCEQVDDLALLLDRRYLSDPETSLEEMEMISPKEAASKFDEFCTEKKVPEGSPLYKHLRAIFFAGFNESQLNVESLIKTTSSRITAHNTKLRSYISLFIVLGLLGTLFGLAGSLAELSSILSKTDQLNDEILRDGLNTLLGKLSGAFSPSIWGVLFTVIGVFVFARYLGKYSYPTVQLLEHKTLTNWIPNLIPTASQRLLENLYQSEKQMLKNSAAAEKVAELASQVSGETSELRVNIKNNNASLIELNESAAKLGEFTTSFTKNLNDFSQNFKESIEKLPTITEGISEVYQKIQADSQEFQESIKDTLDTSQTFRSQVKEEFDRQSEQSKTLLDSLKFYENAYLENRESTDEKIQSTLSAAEKALENLGQQNEVFVKELVAAIGDPLREELKTELDSLAETLKDVTTNSNTTLNGLSKNIGDEIHNIASGLGALEEPLTDSAKFVEATATNFKSSTESLLKELRRDFQAQNDNKNNENTNISSLDNNIQNLIQEINNLSNKLNNNNQRNTNYSSPKKHPKKKRITPAADIAESMPSEEKGFIKRMFEKIPFIGK